MKQIEVQIMGQSYLLGCPEGGEKQLKDAVGRVDVAMCQIRDGGKIKARDRIAVLAALNMAFETVAAPASAAPAVPVAPSPAPLSDDDNARLAALVARLDSVLAADGQLI